MAVSIKGLWKTAVALLGVALLVSSCGGSSSSGAIGGGGVALTVLDGYIQGAIVFLDKNKNGEQDPGEPVAINTNPALGEYTFKGISQATLNQFPVVVKVPVGAIDLDHPNQPVSQVYNMKAPVGAGVFSPMTTLLQSQMENNPGMTLNQAQTQLKKLIGLPANSTVDLTANYVTQAGANATAYNKVHKVAQSVAATVATNQGKLKNAAPALTNQATLVDLMVQHALAKLPTIVMKVDVAGNKFDPATTGSLIGSGFQMNVNTLQQQLIRQNAKLAKPRIVLNGSAVMSVVKGGTFTDPGAVATSNKYGDISASIAKTGAVKVAKLGTYTITYNVSDVAVPSNTAAPVHRTVNVIAAADVTPPVLTLIGGNVSFAAGTTPYVEQGAVALDNADGDISSAVAITGLVQSGVPGTYTLTYNVTDAAGNAAIPVTRTVNVTAAPGDTTPATIVLKGAAVMTVVQPTTFADPGANAVDLVDGTSPVTPTGAVNVNAVGRYTLTYNHTDKAGNVSSPVSRIVNVIAAPDTTAPVITLTGNANITVNQGMAYVDAGATAFDAVDGNLTTSMIVKNPVDVTTVGTYRVTYNVTDAAGNSTFPKMQVTRIVNVKAAADATPPVLTLNGRANITIFKGTIYNDAGATAIDLKDGDITAKIKTTNLVNTGVAATYTVTYNVADAAGNAAAQLIRTVTVTATPALIDNTPPVITLNGLANVTLELGSGYMDMGATAFDTKDGVLTAIKSGIVNTASIGTYTLNYNVTDAAGNQAIQATRTVKVVDTTAPVVTPPAAVKVEATGVTSAVTLGTAMTTDLGTPVLTATASPVGPYAVGTHTITWAATDAAGNVGTAIQTVTITDHTAPAVTAPSAITIEAIGASTSVNLGNATVADAVTAGLTATAAPAGPYAVGVHTITWTSAADASGNVGTATQTVTVTDTTAPVVTAPLAVTIEATGATTSVTLGNATVADIVTAGLTATATPAGPYAVGVHTITWRATDIAGNIGTATQIVTVTDTTAPFVTAPSAVTIEATGATTTVTLGTATVADAVTAGLTATATPAGPYAVGVHTITWTSAADASGNVGTATQTVTVTDKTGPAITVTTAPATIEAGLTYTDAGATATDLVNGAVSPVASGTVNSTVPGSYTITYTATDAKGNVSTATRVITVTDTTPPVITAPAGITGFEATGLQTTVPLGTATVTDNAAASVAATPSQTLFPVGTTVVNWTAKDASGNAAVVKTQSVKVIDTTPAVIALNNPTYSLLLNGAYADPGAIAADLVDGNVAIAGVGLVAAGTLGAYPVTYNYTDAAGNVAIQVTRTVNVVNTPDTTPPVISLLGSATVNLSVGAIYTDAGVTASDNRDGNLTSSVVTVNPVNMNTAGTYTITYNVSDAAGNAAAQVIRTVVVAPLNGGALADNQINNGKLIAANTTYANMLVTNSADIEAVLGVSLTAMAKLVDNQALRTLATQFTLDAGASLPSGAVLAKQANTSIPAINPILVNWVVRPSQLVNTAITANQLQDPALDPVVAELGNSITRLEALKVAGFTSQVVRGKIWDMADVDALLGVLYSERGLIRWSRAYNWNTTTNSPGVPDMFDATYTDIATGFQYTYKPVSSDPVSVLNDPSFFTLGTNGATLLSGASADFLAGAKSQKAFYTAMLNNVARRSDGIHPFLAEKVKFPSKISPPNQQWGPLFDVFGNPVLDQFGNQVWGPIQSPPAPTRILNSADLNQKILNATHIITALSSTGVGLNVRVIWPNQVATTGALKAHKAFTVTPLTRALLNTFEYRDPATSAVVVPNKNLSMKYNKPVISEVAAPTTALGWMNFVPSVGSLYVMSPSGQAFFIVKANIDIAGSTNASTVLPVNDGTLGGVLSTGIDLNTMNNNQAAAGTLPKPKTIITYP